MELQAFKLAMDSLNRNGARYLLAGGMAVVAHGYGRMTFDIDIVVELQRDNILKSFAALTELGYRPRIPITAEQFADETLRRKWQEEKGMTVLNLFSDRFPGTTIDIFASEPFRFPEVFARSPEGDVEGVTFRYVDIHTLIKMKEDAGRPVDLEDVRHLRIIADDHA